MELQLAKPAVAAQRQADSPSTKVLPAGKVGRVRNNGKRTRLQPLTRDMLDGRTNAAKLYDHRDKALLL